MDDRLKYLKVETMECMVYAGSPDSYAIQEACKLADMYQATVKFEFNGRPIIVRPEGGKVTR